MPTASVAIALLPPLLLLGETSKPNQRDVMQSLTGSVPGPQCSHIGGRGEIGDLEARLRVFVTLGLLDGL